MSANQLLDQARSVAQIDAIDAGAYVEQLRAELPAGTTLDTIVAIDTALRDALAAIDAFASRAMRTRLDHALTADTSLGTPFVKTIGATITRYVGDLALLRERVETTAARADPRGAAATADAVVDAARAVLDQRTALANAVIVLARELATAALPEARRAAKDRATDDAVRLRWSAARRDLEATIEQPERVAAAAYAGRVQGMDAVLDEPDPEASPSFGELLELD